MRLFLSDTRIATMGMSVCFSSACAFFTQTWGEFSTLQVIPYKPSATEVGCSSSSKLKVEVHFLSCWPPCCQWSFSEPFLMWQRLGADGSSCRVKMKTNKGQSCQKWLIIGPSRIYEISQHFPWLFLFDLSGQFIVLYSALLCLNFFKTKKSKSKLILPSAPNFYQQDHSLCKMCVH